MDFMNDLDEFEMVDDMDDWMPLEHQMAFHWRDIGIGLEQIWIISNFSENYFSTPFIKVDVMDDDFDHMGMRVGAGGGIMNDNNDWNNDTPQGKRSQFKILKSISK